MEKRLADTKLDDLRFEYSHKPMVAKEGMNVSQLYYAKKGIITPEMEYVAIRENQKIEQLETSTKGMAAQHHGDSFGANTPKERLPRNLYAAKSLPEEQLYRIISTILKANP